MKKLKGLLVLFLALAMIFSFIGCDDDNKPCENHVDEDKDLKCDVCGEVLEDEGGGDEDDEGLKLIENGEAKFQFVATMASGSQVMNAIKNYIKAMGKLGIDIELVDDDEATVKDCEILIGEITSRGDKYNYNEHTLGKKGYVTTRIDNKIIIAAETNALILEHLEAFLEDVLLYEKKMDKEDVSNISFTKENEVLYVQDDYRIPDITINGVTIKEGYNIATDRTSAAHNNAAKTLQDTFYTRAGIWLDIVPLDEATDKSIVIMKVDKTDGNGNPGPAGKDGFLVKATKEGRLNILCAYDNALAGAMDSFVAMLGIKTEAINFTSDKSYFTKEVSVVRYEDYEELTDDDRTNDFEALIEVHAYANEGGQPVYAESGGRYYITETFGKMIVIKTDCYFGNAKFFIDDSFITTSDLKTRHGGNIFKIAAETAARTYSESNDYLKIWETLNEVGVKTTTTEIPLNLGYDVLIIPYDFSRYMYKRGGTDTGDPQHEAIIVRADNTVDPSTPPLFDFDKVDQVVVCRIDDPTITISGGHFETYATRADKLSLNRGIGITRSNVIIDGMDHFVDNQPLGPAATTDPDGDICYNGGGPNYNGWLWFQECNNVTVQNTKLCGRTHYREGSYDIGGGNANKLVFKNCTQYNMYSNEEKEICWEQTKDYWGIMGTSYCKNIEYYNCILSRLDAHAGVYNIVIKDSKIRTVSAVGGGTALFENSKIYQGSVISLRSDYASSWRGDIIVKNVVLAPESSVSNVGVVSGTVHNADFGFNTAIPNVYVENLTHTKGANYKHFYVFTLSCDQSFINGGEYKNSPIWGKVAEVSQPDGYQFAALSSHPQYGNKFPYVEEYKVLPYTPSNDD